MDPLAPKVADRYAASLSDNPEKWRNQTREFLKQRGKFRKERPFREFVLHLAESSDNLYFDMAATTQDGSRVVAWLFYGPWNADESSEDLEGAIEVDPAFRRQGLATAMYAWAEQLTGKKFAPGIGHSSDAAAFWRQKNRPFGR